jgi:hypothetical protein
VESPASLPSPWLLALLAGGLFVGLFLMVRGFQASRTAARIGDTAPSRIASLAVGEALVTGIVEAAELTLVSPLQSAACVYYRSRIETDDDGVSSDYHDERAVGFRLVDDSGELRVFPRGARFDVPDRFSGRDGAMGDRPPGLSLRTGSAFGPGRADREMQIAALLSARSDGGGSSGSSGSVGDDGRTLSFSMPAMRIGRGRRSYREARIEPGDVVTVVGRAMPFDQLTDPASADVAGLGRPLDDPEVAADLAEARSAGILETDPAEAWGNAAIPGFGVGRPTRAPELDPDATVPSVPPAGDARAALAERTFSIEPSSLILAADPEVPLIVSLGAPAAAAWRHQQTFGTGLLGAVLAIVSAVALALTLTSSGVSLP